ncbi:MAG: VOC family protein [Deltaproteobacteria bacterium]|nr:VOC family protein [Deltaproteobacteria bacterium]
MSSSNRSFKVRLHHVHVFASDIRATLKFWQDMFGAQILFDTEIAGVRNVMIAVGSGRINIYDQSPRPGGGGAYHHLGIQTDDLESLIAHMADKGFSFRGSVREYGTLRYMMALAPDNILLELFQILPEKTPSSQQPIMKAFDFTD